MQLVQIYFAVTSQFSNAIMNDMPGAVEKAMLALTISLQNEAALSHTMSGICIYCILLHRVIIYLVVVYLAGFYFFNVIL